MTNLTKPVHRRTSYTYHGKPVIITLAPAGSQNEALVGLRIKGQRTQYVLALSDIYCWAAEHYGAKMKAAKKAARKAGISWRIAKKQFAKSNSIPA